MRAYQLTIAYEKLDYLASRSARGAGHSERPEYRLRLDRRQLPPIYEWTDSRKRADIHRPAAVVAAGNWTGASLTASVSTCMMTLAGATGALAVLHTGSMRRAIRISGSQFRDSGDGAVELNHVQICARNNLPGPDLMRCSGCLAVAASGRV